MGIGNVELGIARKRGAKPAPGTHPTPSSRFPVPTIRWFSPNRFGTLVVSRLEAAGYRVLLEGEGPADLAVAIDGQCAVSAYEFARRRGCPLLLYLWDLPPWRLGSGQPDAVFEWRGRVRRVPRIIGGYRERSGFYSRLRFVARRARAVWTPSRLTADDLEARFGVRAEEVPYCYDSDRFTWGEWEPRVPPRLLVVSRLVEHKNHEAVLRAAAAMTPRPVVQFVGHGPDAARLVGLARELAVDLLVDDAWQSDEDVVTAYRDATVVVAPSRFEGFGLTAIEAIAAGVPAVASDIPPHREHLGDAVNWFALEDHLGLITAIRTALERGPVSPDLVHHLTIDAAAGRFLDRLPRLLCRAG
jgi:glycosyltransferase involved in cell wall biosynthesis